MLTSPAAKENTKIIVTSNPELYDGDSLSVKLTNLNNIPIANQTVDIAIIDNNGMENHQSVITTADGNSSLRLNGISPDNYTVKVNYSGNEEYMNCNTTENLKIKEKEIQKLISDNLQVRESTENNLPDVDSGGVTREEAEAYGWEYTPDHGGHYIGVNDRRDEEAGMYHD